MGFEHIKVDDEKGYPVCDEKDCELPVHVTLVWTDFKQYCLIHGNKALGVASAMGFPTPSATIEQFDLYEFELWKAKQPKSETEE